MVVLDDEQDQIIAAILWHRPQKYLLRRNIIRLRNATSTRISLSAEDRSTIHDDKWLCDSGTIIVIVIVEASRTKFI